MKMQMDIHKAALIKHYQSYPEMQIRDMFKFIYQSAFGCEHLLSDPSAAIDYIRKEAERCKPHAGELVESLYGAYCRVHLDYLEKGLSAETFGKLFFLSAVPNETGREQLEESIALLTELSEEGVLPFEKEAVAEAVESWCQEGYPTCHHSERFRERYAPAYRLMKKEYALFLPLFTEIDCMLRQGKVTLAIEGGSASGKTTLGRLLEQLYDCQVFHMDDFFLRPEQRTEKRLAEPGGNVDRERFWEEVLLPMGENKPIAYRRFDCSMGELLPPITRMPGKLNVIEGAYSMHPELAGAYNLSVFLDITPHLQEMRIRKRNAPQLAERFFKEWIPLEQKYFEELHVKEHCAMTIEIKDNFKL